MQNSWEHIWATLHIIRHDLMLIMFQTLWTISCLEWNEDGV